MAKKYKPKREGKMNRIIAGLVISLNASIALASPPLLDSLNTVFSDSNYQNTWVETWMITDHNQVALLLGRRRPMPSNPTYYYAFLDSSGRFITKPDSVEPILGSIGGSSDIYLMDNKCRAFKYYNESGLGNPNTGQLQFWMYDPINNKRSDIEFPEPYLGCITAGDYIPNVGNVLLTKHLRLHYYGPHYKIVIHKKPGKKAKSSNFNFPKSFNQITDVKIHRLETNNIILIGNGLDKGEFILRWMVYNIKKGELISYNEIEYSDLNAPEFQSADSSNIAQLIEKDGRLYYFTPVIERLQWSKMNRYYNRLVAEFDFSGNLMTDDNRTITRIREKSLKSTPNNFILIPRRFNRKYKFWMASLDSLPVLLIDKGD